MPQTPLINGNRYSFASLTLWFNGFPFVGFKEISYDQSLTPGQVRGAHPQMLGRTRGKLEANASATFYKEEWNEILAALGDGYMEAPLSIDVTYSENGETPKIDKLKGLRIQKHEDSHSEGEDPTEVKVEFSIMWIEPNGKKPLRKML